VKDNFVKDTAGTIPAIHSVATNPLLQLPFQAGKGVLAQNMQQKVDP
jgi:hypothetical protein